MPWQPVEVTVDTTTGLTKSVTAYTAGDQVGLELTLANMALANAGYGAITAVQLVDDGDVIGSYELVFFNGATTEAADNAAAAWSDADLAKKVGSIYLPTSIDYGGAREAYAGGLWVPYKTGAASRDLIVSLVARSGHAFFTADDDLHLRVETLQYS